MSRVQLALKVSDVGTAVDLCSKLFATEPAKVRPGVHRTETSGGAGQ